MTANRTRRIVALSGALLLGLTSVLSAQPAITRTVLQRADMSRPRHEAVTAKADFPVSIVIANYLVEKGQPLNSR